MNRRQALKSIGVAAALPLSPSELSLIGRATHAHLQAEGGGDRYVFQCLDSEESEILSAATELILPETDTPGARSAKVPEFIDAVLIGWFQDVERQHFLRGLHDLDARARSSEGVGFLGMRKFGADSDTSGDGARGLRILGRSKPQKARPAGSADRPGSAVLLRPQVAHALRLFHFRSRDGAGARARRLPGKLRRLRPSSRQVSPWRQSSRRKSTTRS